MSTDAFAAADVCTHSKTDVTQCKVPSILEMKGHERDSTRTLLHTSTPAADYCFELPKLPSPAVTPSLLFSQFHQDFGFRVEPIAEVSEGPSEQDLEAEATRVFSVIQDQPEFEEGLNRAHYLSTPSAAADNYSAEPRHMSTVQTIEETEERYGAPSPLKPTPPGSADYGRFDLVSSTLSMIRGLQNPLLTIRQRRRHANSYGGSSVLPFHSGSYKDSLHSLYSTNVSRSTDYLQDAVYKTPIGWHRSQSARMDNPEQGGASSPLTVLLHTGREELVTGPEGTSILVKDEVEHIASSNRSPVSKDYQVEDSAQVAFSPLSPRTQLEKFYFEGAGMVLPRRQGAVRGSGGGNGSPSSPMRSPNSTKMNYSTFCSSSRRRTAATNMYLSGSTTGSRSPRRGTLLNSRTSGGAASRTLQVPLSISVNNSSSFGKSDKGSDDAGANNMVTTPPFGSKRIAAFRSAGGVSPSSDLQAVQSAGWHQAFSAFYDTEVAVAALQDGPVLDEGVLPMGIQRMARALRVDAEGRRLSEVVDDIIMARRSRLAATKDRGFASAAHTPLYSQKGHVDSASSAHY